MIYLSKILHIISKHTIKHYIKVSCNLERVTENVATVLCYRAVQTICLVLDLYFVTEMHRHSQHWQSFNHCTTQINSIFIQYYKCLHKSEFHQSHNCVQK